MTHNPNIARPCSAILSATMQPRGRITGNDSSSVWECMSWGYEGNPRNIQCAHNDSERFYLSQSAQLDPNRTMRVKCGCCEDGEMLDVPTTQYQSERERDQYHGNNAGQGQYAKQGTQKVNIKNYVEKQKQTKGGISSARGNQVQSGNNNNMNQKRPAPRARSPPFEAPAPAYNRMEVEQIKKRRLNELMKSKEKSLDRIKVEEYVESQKPFTRGMSNSRFRTFYGKQCMEAYGRANTNQPIGGIIYGNHLKTFNINPHASSNDPTYYQTHTTSLNFAKRTKLDEQKNWKMLEKQLGKQLHLKAVNETLIPGKDVIYQQVTSDNMYAAMKVNHEFAKSNRGQIREQERDYKRNQVLKQWAVQDQYKAQRQQDKQILKNAPLGSTMAASEDEEAFRRAVGSAPIEERMNQQVIYKMIDSEGNVRYGADRHSLTCFVDTNFPQNAAAYKAELMNRNQIFPIKVKEEDRHLDEIRKQNYVESVVNNYPAHYLIPNVDYSKVVLKPKTNRKGEARSLSKQKRPQSAYPGTRQVNQNKAVFQNTKVGANVNQNRGNVVGSPKNRVQFEGNNYADKNNYFNQSTKGTLGATYGNQVQGQQGTAISKHHASTGYAGESSNEACSRYTNSLKHALLNQSTKNPHFATQLLVKASDNPYTIPAPNQRLVNEEYDPRNYYPHAKHEMKPQLHHHIKSTKIPYAGVESKILDAIY